MRELIELAVIAMIIYGVAKSEKLIRLERAAFRIVAVFMATLKSWRKERKQNDRRPAQRTL